MAQDFYAAFGKDSYGAVGNDTTIAQADMDGVSFIAIQALEKRTAELQKKVAELNALIARQNKDNSELKAELIEKDNTINTRLQAIEAELQKGKITGK